MTTKRYPKSGGSRYLHTVPELVTIGLKYCCLWAFFKANEKARTGLIATRLGVSSSTAKLWRRKYKDGLMTCQAPINENKCLKKVLDERKTR